MGNGMNKILPGLYLGNYRDSKDPAQLSKYNITHIVSVHESSKPILPDKKYLCLVASDVSTQNLSQFFSETNDFIHEARSNGGNVLVHCLAGVSRSTTIVIAYLMTVSKLAWKECLGAVQQNRPCANPNFGFQRQLLEFQYDNVLEVCCFLFDGWTNIMFSIQDLMFL
ncbi:hypothetical protein HELRODRAFT_64858 [Helobdella robusta]|uniref:Dual specificity protein phosphatase 15 n=1 Tax=Helobdella robusta TaxID=6412 RepID=T1FY04_HELRO|nr:hypothetical protein HELRODRAFT_64858 [Helobdella robusta]ESO06531.1 hypothetical protein HELRODRAFT_64858 [Helobdella robusta]